MLRRESVSTQRTSVFHSEKQPQDFVDSAYPSFRKPRSHSTSSRHYAAGAFENGPDPLSLSLPSSSFMLSLAKKTNNISYQEEEHIVNNNSSFTHNEAS
jgi:hypothetical protein